MNKNKLLMFFIINGLFNLAANYAHPITCVIVNLLINVTHYLELQEWLTNLLSIIEIAFVVCTANYLCGYTNSIIELDNFIGVTFMSVTVYFFVKAVVFMKNNEDAKKINEKLKRNRHRN